MQSINTFDPIPTIANELALQLDPVKAVLDLIDQGGTVPFIARYRKEATGGLDEEQIRTIQQRREYLNELEQRKQAILASIQEQGKLTDELQLEILACTTKSVLEDLYRPYKPKKRTRATIARERGLEPLAKLILSQSKDGNPEQLALAYVDPEKKLPDVEHVLLGARDIVAEEIADRADIRAMVRQQFSQKGELVASVRKEAKDQRTKFEDYYNFRELSRTIPSHRYLALCRGENEKVLQVSLEAANEILESSIAESAGLCIESPFAEQLRLAASDSYKRLIAPSVETEIRSELKQKADETAVGVFASNLRNLLLASPLGEKPVFGIDPGLRTGCKCVVIDATGKFIENTTLYLGQGEAKEKAAFELLLQLINKYKPFAIAIGNGTGGREAEAWVRTLLRDKQLTNIIVIQVNEAGASVYSASKLARQEFPDLDVTVRGSISIARRLQDPLAELVKIDPKAIGVGQYQHDVDQSLLKRKLDDVVETCVNQVGVEANTASAPLLAQVAGIGPSLAQKIVVHREEKGLFESRQELLKVPGLGPRAFEQAAGFIRIRNSKNPLDASAVHPERYKLVQKMALDLNVELHTLVGNPKLADSINIQNYISDEIGEPTLKDILDELRKPGRDPRANFEAPCFRDDVHTLEDLQKGMTLDGVVTNVTAFGAFVDIGVHQDGLVHISELSDHFVKDPHQVVSVGQRLKVRVLDVDLVRRRISLSAKSPGKNPPQKHPQNAIGKPKEFANNPFADLIRHQK